MPCAALICAALICAAAVALPPATASAADTKLYKWVDADGVTHYSDTPADGAKKVDVPAAQSYSAPPRATSSPAPAAKPVPAEPANGGYTRVYILQPAPDETFANVSNIDLVGKTEPEVLPGHDPWIVLDGKRIANATSAIVPAERGSHVVALEIEDASGAVVASSPSVTFHVQKKSVQPPPRGPTLTPRKR